MNLGAAVDGAPQARDTCAGMFWRSRINRITPAKLRVAARGQARLQVEGESYGSIRVGRERRWVWGPFDESFVVPFPHDGGAISISLFGLGGRQAQQVECGPVIDVRSPPVVSALPAVTTSIRLPRMRRLAARRILAPLVVHLKRAPIQSSTSETEHKS